MSAASTSLTLLVWALLSIAALSSREGRLRRSVAVGVALCIFGIFSGLGITPAPGPVSAWLLVLLLAATASLGPSTLATSHIAFALSGIVLQYANPAPIHWLGLLHQVALLDLASCSAATVGLVLMGYDSLADLRTPAETGGGSSGVGGVGVRCVGVMRRTMPMLACPIFFRNSLMVLTLIGTSLFALRYATYQNEPSSYQNEPSGVLGGILGIWMTVSEVVAAIVAWQIVRGSAPAPQKANPTLTNPQEPTHVQTEAEPTTNNEDFAPVGSTWSHKIAFAVAGISASLALLLVPLILNAASELDW